jgi:hypothetical protein
MDRDVIPENPYKIVKHKHMYIFQIAASQLPCCAKRTSKTTILDSISEEINHCIHLSVQLRITINLSSLLLSVIKANSGSNAQTLSSGRKRFAFVYLYDEIDEQINGFSPNLK